MSDGGFSPDNIIKQHRNSESFGVVIDSRTKQPVRYPSIPISNVSNSIKMMGQKKTIFPDDFRVSPNKITIKNDSFKSKNNVHLPYSSKEILKCVFSLSRCPFGKEHIIDILVGMHTSKIKRHNHERLFEHGKLKKYTRAELRELISKLIQDKYMIKRGGGRPTIIITKKGIEYLKSFGINK